MSSEMSNLLGPLTHLAANAQEWRTRGTRTWAGLWFPDDADNVLNVVAQHTVPADEVIKRRLARTGSLAGVRDFSLLTALLLEDGNGETDISCVINTKNTRESETDEEEDEPLFGIPIWNHGMLERAKLTPVQHAVHLVRHLDDFHEPTLASLRRRRLRALRSNASDNAQQQAAQSAATAFLEQPVFWRDVVTTAVYLATLRELEGVLGRRIAGRNRTTEEIKEKIDAGIGALMMSNAMSTAAQISQKLEQRLRQLASARVVLNYHEQKYLQLTGICAGRSVRRHLPVGLHLIFSSQQHRREDRTAGLWLRNSRPEQNVGSYYWSNSTPPSYAEHKKSAYFRLSDAAAVYTYVASLE